MTVPEQSKDGMIEDAQLLLRHAAATGKEVDRAIIAAITATGDRSGVAAKYAELARLMSPVTAETLRATDDAGGMSQAKVWSRTLWRWTIGFALAILIIENYGAILARFYALDEFSSGTALVWHGIGVVLATVVPFAYGGLGAAAFLLRACHGHLHARTFDPRHIPEYYSRMLLGVIAGGAIQLLITNVADESGVIKLSAAALAFVAGYNSDLLFNTVERVSAALLPKVGVSSVRRADQDPMAGVSVTALIEQLDNAKTEEAREAVRGLLARVGTRM